MDRRDLFHDMEKHNALDPYYIAYYIMSIGLKQDSFESGVSKSLYFARMYMLSDDVYLYRLEDDGNFYSFSHSPFISFKPSEVHSFIYGSQDKLKTIKENVEFDFLDDKVHRMNFVPFSTKKNKYMLFILNNSIDDEKKNKDFLDLLKKSYSVLIQNAENYWDLERISKEDALTGLENRLSYSRIIDFLGDLNITYVLIDLFRLKFINDQYGHEAGDTYIKKAAEALKKLFPTYRIVISEDDGVIKKRTGNHIFRIGGDEFVLISEHLSEDEVEDRIKNISLFLEEIPFVKKITYP